MLTAGSFVPLIDRPTPGAGGGGVLSRSLWVGYRSICHSSPDYTWCGCCHSLGSVPSERKSPDMGRNGDNLRASLSTCLSIPVCVSVYLSVSLSTCLPVTVSDPYGFV